MVISNVEIINKLESYKAVFGYYVMSLSELGIGGLFALTCYMAIGLKIGALTLALRVRNLCSKITYKKKGGSAKCNTIHTV